jgi:hypothetical protein
MTLNGLLKKIEKGLTNVSKLLHPTAIPVVKNIIASIPNTTLKQQVEALFAGVLPAPSEAEVKSETPVKEKPVEAKKEVPATPVASATASVAPIPVKAAVEAPQPVVEPSKATVETSKAMVEPTQATTTPLTISKPLSKEEIKQIKKAVVNAGILTQLAADQAFGS